MKKLLAIVLSLTLIMAMSAGTFAAPQDTADEKEPILRDTEERPNSVGNLFDLYYPEGSSIHEALQAEHEAFHSSREALRAELQAEHEANKAEMRAQFEAYKAEYDAGNITREEFQALIAPLKEEVAAKKAELEVIRAELDVIKAEKQAANEALKAQREANKAIIMTALQSDPVDEAAIAAALASGLDLLSQHIDLDYYYAAQVDAVLADH